MYWAFSKTPRAEFLNAVYFRRGLTCTIGLANNLIGGEQPRAKTCFGFTLHRWGLALGWPLSIKSLVNPRVCVRLHLR